MPVALTQMNLAAVRDRAAATDLLRRLGYEAAALPFDARERLGVDGEATVVRDGRSPSRGYCALVLDAERPLRGMKALARRLVLELHDRPLLVVGHGDGAGWREFTVARPRLLAGGGGSVALARLTVDPRRPTRHDVEVLRGIAWEPEEDAERNHERIDRAFDVERVTRRFFLGLAERHRAIAETISEAVRDRSVAAGVERAGGVERVALRIVNQVLFCYFLQRKELLGGDRAYLSTLWRRRGGPGFYAEVLEPLFYDALGLPEGDRRPEWRGAGVPFLDGGLFERAYGRVSLPLPGELFSADDEAGLLHFLDGWTFTVAEDEASDAEVAVDPEMLGKVFENLIGDEEARRQGTVYTPRPVVQFMCREALVPYLAERARLSEADARLLLTREDGDDIDGVLARPGQAALIDRALRDLRVIDPAVGSGAFPLGMLSEVVRLRRMCHLAQAGDEPGAQTIRDWKLHAIEHSLFGVDINPTAIELFRLRMWLALLVDLPAGQSPAPLPNLEYRAVCADALPDFLAGVEVQQTRAGSPGLAVQTVDPGELQALRDLYFETTSPAGKATLRREIEEMEAGLLEEVFHRARVAADAQAASGTRTVAERGERARADVEELLRLFRSDDRVFPLFLPAFHAPDVFARDDAGERGWDIAIMNPPYVGRKEVRRRLDATRLADYERHYGRTFDLMIHFAFRALELVRPGGVVSIIFNDSIFTSQDADELRRALCGEAHGGRGAAVRAAARTRCFEGKAVNGGVVVAVRDGVPGPFRWVENYGRPTAELLAASGPESERPGESELFAAQAEVLTRLPHRPLFRPAPEALRGIEAFERTAFWDEFSRWEAPTATGADWRMLSETSRLERWKKQAEREGRLARLRRGRDFVLLGLVTDGGVGLQTSDDRRFLAAIDGTCDAEEARRNAERYEGTLGGATRDEFLRLLAGGLSREAALIALTERFSPAELGWPRSGLVRVAAPEAVRRTALSPDEVRSGIASGPAFVPFEKGDSGDGGLGARWRRDNPIVIDWSPEAVALLRARAAGERHRRPYFRNEHLWGRGGVTWNRVASYLRARLVPPGAIFADMAPTIAPTVDWLTDEVLVALLNGASVDFILRTFLGSRMHIEIGNVRRIPIPVLTEPDAEALSDLGTAAISAKEDLDRGGPPGPLREVEAEIDARVRELYGYRPGDELWVVR